MSTDFVYGNDWIGIGNKLLRLCYVKLIKFTDGHIVIEGCGPEPVIAPITEIQWAEFQRWLASDRAQQTND